MGAATEELYSQIEENYIGVEQFETGLEKLQSVTDAVRKGVMTVIGAGSGSGKTTFVLFNYIYKPILDCIKKDKKNLRILIFCLELTKSEVMSKILSMYLFEKYGIELSLRELLSFTCRLSDKNLEIVREAKEFMNKVENFITFIEGDLTASKFADYMIKYYSRRGIFSDEGKNRYVPKDSSLITLAIIDHIGETKVEERETEKMAQDNLAEELKKFRNICGLSSIVVQQLNRGSSTVDRRTKFPGIELWDLKGTGNVSEKANNVIGLYNPYRDKIKSWGDYNVVEMKGILRGIQVLKNRYGMSDVNIGLAFYGHPSVMKELPKGEMISDYSPYKTSQYYRSGLDNHVNIEDI